MENFILLKGLMAKNHIRIYAITFAIHQMIFKKISFIIVLYLLYIIYHYTSSGCVGVVFKFDEEGRENIQWLEKESELLLEFNIEYFRVEFTLIFIAV